MNFIADVMLGSLAKRLRLLGFDVLYDTTFSDNDVLRLALEQGRVILTRDTGLASRPVARNHVLIKSDHVDEQVRQVFDAFSVPDAVPLTRCSVCNSMLVQLTRDGARNIVPEHVYATITVFFQCGQCGRVYWRGSHVKRWEERLGID
jgi:uncharacterized protein